MQAVGRFLPNRKKVIVKYAISFVAALPSHVLLILAINKLGINFKPFNSVGEFIASWFFASVIYFCYLFAINRAAQHSVQADLTDSICYNGNHESKNGVCVVDGGIKPSSR